MPISLAQDMLIEQAASGEPGGTPFAANLYVQTVSVRAEFEHPVVATVNDIDVAGGIHRHTDGLIDAGERENGWRVRTGGQSPPR